MSESKTITVTVLSWTKAWLSFDDVYKLWDEEPHRASPNHDTHDEFVGPSSYG